MTQHIYCEYPGCNFTCAAQVEAILKNDLLRTAHHLQFFIYKNTLRKVGVELSSSEGVFEKKEGKVTQARGGG